MRTKLLHRTSNKPMKGNPNNKWTSIIHLLNAPFLKVCFHELNKNAAPGIDGITKEEYGKNLDENISNLLKSMKAWGYRPQPSRKVLISKGNNKFRELGIPAIEDKIVQLGIKKILDEIFEPLFLNFSFGFRAGMGCHDALKGLSNCIFRNPVSYVLDADIKNFFGSVNHKLLMKALEVRIADRNFLRLIGRFLKSGIMEEGQFAKTEEGTPQGGLISPVLANIYLHYALDVWFVRIAKSKLKGFSEIIRYADDFVVCFQFENDAKLFKRMLEMRLSDLHLELADDKTKIVRFGKFPWKQWKNGGVKPETFDFLGFTFMCGKTRKGWFKVELKTNGKRFREKTDFCEYLA